MQLPEATSKGLAGDFPPIDLSILPGGRVVLNEVYRDAHHTIRLVCGAGSARGYAEGVEELILERATSMLATGIGKPVGALRFSEITKAGDHFEQRFQGTVAGAPPAQVHGLHLLGFAGSAPEGVLCTVACSEPAPYFKCKEVIASVAKAGSWSRAPAPSPVAWAILFGATHPLASSCAGGGLFVVLVAWILATRPRPRPHR